MGTDRISHGHRVSTRHRHPARHEYFDVRRHALIEALSRRFFMSELLIIRVPHQQESAVALNGEPLVIGSNPSSHIVVNDPAVLPHHAYLARDQGHWRVAAYDAAVPLTFENQPATDLRLDNGTRFSIGSTQFEFASDGAASERRTRE